MPYPDQPKDTPIPPELDKWNWGAFLLNFIWGIGNNTFRAFWVMVPIYGLYVLYQLGRYGSRWAWQNNLWQNEDHFVRTQRNWKRAGLIVIAVFLLFNIAIFTLIGSIFKNSTAFKSSMEIIKSDERLIDAMGEPIVAGRFVSGSIETNPTGGKADLNIPISGPKCAGNAISNSRKTNQTWTINRLVVFLECEPTPIPLIE